MKRHIHSIVFLLIFAVDFANSIVPLLEYDPDVFIQFSVLYAVAFALAVCYPLIPLAALTALIERAKDRRRLVFARRILSAYLALDILSGILGIWLYDVYAFSLFVPFYSRFGILSFVGIVRHILRYGYLFRFDILLRCVYYIAYALNFALLLRSLSRRIRQGKQTEENR